MHRVEKIKLVHRQVIRPQSVSIYLPRCTFYFWFQLSPTLRFNSLSQFKAEAKISFRRLLLSHCWGLWEFTGIAAMFTLRFYHTNHMVNIFNQINKLGLSFVCLQVYILNPQKMAFSMLMLNVGTRGSICGSKVPGEVSTLCIKLLSARFKTKLG